MVFRVYGRLKTIRKPQNNGDGDKQYECCDTNQL